MMTSMIWIKSLNCLIRGRRFRRNFGSGALSKAFDAVQGCYCKQPLIIYLSLGTSVKYNIGNVLAGPTANYYCNFNDNVWTSFITTDGSYAKVN